MLLSQLIDALEQNDAVQLSNFRTTAEFLRNSCFIEAAASGNLPVVQWILEQNACPSPRIHQTAILAAAQLGYGSLVKACLVAGMWTGENAELFLVALYGACQKGELLTLYRGSLERLGYVLPEGEVSNLSEAAVVNAIFYSPLRDTGIFAEKMRKVTAKAQRAAMRPDVYVSDLTKEGTDYKTLFDNHIKKKQLWRDNFETDAQKQSVEKRLRAMLLENMTKALRGMPHSEPALRALTLIEGCREVFDATDMVCGTSVPGMLTLLAWKRGRVSSEMQRLLANFPDNQAVCLWKAYCLERSCFSWHSEVSPSSASQSRHSIRQRVLELPFVREVVNYTYLVALKEGTMRRYLTVLLEIVKELEAVTEENRVHFQNDDVFIELCVQKLAKIFIEFPVTICAVDALQSQVESVVLHQAIARFSNSNIPLEVRRKLYDALLFLDTIPLQDVMKTQHVLPSGRLAGLTEIKGLLAARADFRAQVFGENIESFYKAIQTTGTLNYNMKPAILTAAYQRTLGDCVYALSVNHCALKIAYKQYLANPIARMPFVQRMKRAGLAKPLGFYVSENLMRSYVFCFMRARRPQGVSDRAIIEIVRHFEKTQQIDFEKEVFEEILEKFVQWQSGIIAGEVCDDLAFSELRGQPCMFADYSAEVALQENIYLHRGQAPTLSQPFQLSVAKVVYEYIHSELAYALYAFYQSQGKLQTSQHVNQAIAALVQAVKREVTLFLERCPPAVMAIENLTLLKRRLIPAVQLPLLSPSVPAVRVQAATAATATTSTTATHPTAVKRKRVQLPFS